MAGEDLELARTGHLDRVLLTLIYCGGSARRASRMLRQSKDQPLRITYPQVQAIRNDNDSRYAQLHDRYVVEIEAFTVRELRQASIGAFVTAMEAIEQAREDLADGEVKDPGKLARDMAVTGGILTDKMLVLTGRPNQIQEKRNVDEILADIARSIKDETTTVEARVVDDPALPEEA